MFGQKLFSLRNAALTAALLVLSAAAPSAARPVYHGAYHAPAGAYHGGRYGTHYYGGRYGVHYYGGRYQGYRGYYPGRYYPWLGAGLGYYYAPYLYGYPTTDYVYTTPSVVEYQNYYPVLTNDTLTNETPTNETPPPAPTAAAPLVSNTATVVVHVPADADVWFNGQLTTQKGEVRQFASPPLTPGMDYRYDIRARWTQGGGVVEQTRTIVVRANEVADVDFNRPEPTAAPIPLPPTK